ncbi:aspartic proteinase-like protein 1 [Actinidia eriantha]|uniref:aspartic proteinase-like protein 1 n=1 Tax=Actinidia eriantha TaxID=165200 RepID=UPI002585B64E|nr:aspartic proteinase-like protein 1 [Actinidia eriantha]
MAAARFAVILLMASLFIDTSVAVTYTSKLIHRFSDEAKSFWSSRNGNVSWPKQRSVDFFRRLLSSDAKRQRLKIGSQNKLLVPSEGSETLFYGNDLGWLHYTWIDIGTPNVSFLVALDAGSDLLWVPCDCIQCAPLSSTYYNMLDRDLSEYIPLVSNTSKRISCSHHLCELSPTCKSPKEPCPYNVDYYSENTSSSGFLFEDKLQLASVGDYVSQSLVQASVIIGCGRKQSGSYLNGAAPDGIMGLGLGDISVPSLLAKAALIQNSFSLCIDETYSGRIVFGDQGLATQQYTLFLPLQGKYITYLVEVTHYCIGSSCLKQTGFQALVDSGTSFSYLPHEIYEKVVLEFDKRVDARRAGLEGFPYCYEASSQDLLNIPSMELMFAMNQSFVIENPMFQITDNQEATLLCLGIHPTDEVIGIIGQNLMTGYRMVFDRENLKLGWSHSNCQDIGDSKRMHLAPPPNDIPPNPLPTNEQQNDPSTHGVAPAVAERAPSKPSRSNALTRSWLCSVYLLLLLLSLHCGYLL